MKSKMVKLTENDIKKIIHDVVFHLHKTVDNPLCIDNYFRNNPLMEGYFKTYPPEKIEYYLKKKYGDYATIILTKNENDVDVFIIGFFNDEENEDYINKDMAMCGYFPSCYEIRDNIKYVQYEPRHQNKINDLVQDEEYIYHLTKTSKVSKILQNGLTPKTNNKKFKYPDRVYFFLHEPSIDDCLFLMKQFHFEESKNKKVKQYFGTYTLLAIDTEQIKNVDFAYDPNAFECIYTYDNIPPSAIEIVEEIEQEYLNNKDNF